MRKRDVISFSNKKRSRKGICSILLGGAAFITTLFLIIFSSSSGGNGGLVTGMIGIALVLLVLGGFLLALRALYERDVQPLLPMIALLLNGILIIFYLCLYILGI